MSYNIDSCRYLSGKLFIKRSVVNELYCIYEKTMAEGNLLEEIVDENKTDLEEIIEITKPWWYGGFSGNSIEVFEKILAHTTGTAEILVTWEGGDSHSGYLVQDGKVYPKKVKHVLE